MNPNTSDSIDSAVFTLPPKVARLDAVRKLAVKLAEVTGLGETAALTVAEAVVDPSAVRTALGEPLPGLTAVDKTHLQVIPTRVWAPWITPPADEMLRYSTQKQFPVANPEVPPTPYTTRSADGVTVPWKNRADRTWHGADNRRLYAQDIHRDSLHLFPGKGGIVHPIVVIPQTETFADGSDTLHSLRIEDGRYRYYGVLDLLERYAGLDQDDLAKHLGPDITPEIFGAALARDRSALLKVINAVRAACTRIGEVGEWSGQHIGVHYLATALSLPAYIVVGAVEPNTGRTYPLGGEPDAVEVLRRAVFRWHGGSPAELVRTGQQNHNGLLLPEARVDTGLLAVADKRLKVRKVPQEVIDFGYEGGKSRAAAQFIWWCRAVSQLGGTPATAVAGFAAHSDGPWPEGISGALLACASHVMEEDRDSIYPPGDYRNAEARPDSLTFLVSDTRNLAAVAGLSSGGQGGVLVHPRFRNAVHIALAHLALIGALPAQDPLPTRLTGHVHLLSQVALSWSSGQNAVFPGPDGAAHTESGRPVPIDERTLNRDDLPWPEDDTAVSYLTPPDMPQPFPGATHAFKLRHDVIYTVPAEPLDPAEITEDPAVLAQAVRRWFPRATAIVFTDWSDKYISGVMVGSVYVRLFDRTSEREEGRRRGVWYPEGNPAGTADVLDFDTSGSGAPVGRLLGAGEWLMDDVCDDSPGVDMIAADEAWTEEFENDIITEADAALETQKRADIHGGSPRQSDTFTVPVLRLPELKGKQ